MMTIKDSGIVQIVQLVQIYIMKILLKIIKIGIFNSHNRKYTPKNIRDSKCPRSI